MITDLELMAMHLRALFTHDDTARLLCINEPGNAVAPAPRMYLGRTRGGNIWRFRADLPAGLVGELDSLCADEPTLDSEFNQPPRHVERYLGLLEKHAPCKQPSGGPAYQFSDEVVTASQPLDINENNPEKLADGFDDFVTELPAWQPFVAHLESNRAVSICRSVRITPEAHEAGVETLPEFRGNGYAKEVVAGWAQRVWSIGAVPLYSTSWENKASQSVAGKLGLKFYGADFEID
jgi:hypothetical protein